MFGSSAVLSSLRANRTFLGEARSAEFGRCPAPAEKPNRSITASAPAAAGDREIFLRAEKRQQKVGVFAYPRGGRNTCVFWRGTSAIFLLKNKISTCVREIGAASAACSPLSSFFFPTLPPLFGGGRRNRRALFQATGGGAFWVFGASLGLTFPVPPQQARCCSSECGVP